MLDVRTGLRPGCAFCSVLLWSSSGTLSLALAIAYGPYNSIKRGLSARGGGGEDEDEEGSKQHQLLFSGFLRNYFIGIIQSVIVIKLNRPETQRRVSVVSRI